MIQFRHIYKLIILLLIFPLHGISQVREKQSINSGWQFVLKDKSALSSLENAQWQKINIPHTWNALDGGSSEKSRGESKIHFISQC